MWPHACFATLMGGGDVNLMQPKQKDGGPVFVGEPEGCPPTTPRDGCWLGQVNEHTSLGHDRELVPGWVSQVISCNHFEEHKASEQL